MAPFVVLSFYLATKRYHHMVCKKCAAGTNTTVISVTVSFATLEVMGKQIVNAIAFLKERKTTAMEII
jgi:hypothetical protein